MGWRISVFITEVDVDHKKLERESRICGACDGSGIGGYCGINSIHNCTQCNSGSVTRAWNADRNCNKCKGSGILKQGKISRTTCTCVLDA